MRSIAAINQKIFGLIVFTLCSVAVFGQDPATLNIKDFAIWGGTSPANTYSSTEGVYLSIRSRIIGKIGSNHNVSISDLSTISGVLPPAGSEIYSGNMVLLRGGSQINGNVFAANKAGNMTGIVMDARDPNAFNGNIQANGKVQIRLGTSGNLATVSGFVAVPDPTATNYSGPVPAGGFSNTPIIPEPPPVPGLEPFDNLPTTINVTGSRVLKAGNFGRMQLKGRATITFDGPGNYVFNEIINSGDNAFVFDLKNTSEGTINIFVVKNALVGKVLVRMINNGATPGKARIYTEVHGTGGTGAAFSVQSPTTVPAGNFIWLGNVWVPNGSILVGGLQLSTTPHIKGTLWSGKMVQTADNFFIEYEGPADKIFTKSAVEPYYPPPINGKVIGDKIGAELNSLVQNIGTIKSIPFEDIYIFSDDNKTRVMIEVVSKLKNNTALKQKLIDQGMGDVIPNGPHEFTITGSFPVDNLLDLNLDPEIEYVRPLFPALTNRGAVTSQGDTTMRSYKVREFFGLDGTGVKIGVLSDSYNRKLGAQDDINNGDLPGQKIDGTFNENKKPVQVVGTDLESFRGGSDEGRAMLQIVHDVAPKADLAFRTGFRSAGDFALGITELASAGSDVIVDDLTYITEPFLRDGIVANTVNTVVANGVTYFTSAGNFGERSYESTFRGVPNTTFNLEAGSQLHQFGNNTWETFQTLQLKKGTYTIVLQWDDPFHSINGQGVINDLDLYIVNPNGLQLFGFNRSNLFKDPFEVCPFEVTEETTAKIIVVKASGTSPTVRFKYIIFRGDAVIADYGNIQPSTIVGHANSEGAISVGAMLYAKLPNVNPNWPDVASFSSRGGTPAVPFIGTQPNLRNKPDIVAPNGVNTTVDLTGGLNNIDGDDFPNFFGTSAAAPHAAAVAGLLIQGRKKYAPQLPFSPEAIRQQLINTAGKFAYLGSPDFSFIGGYGFTQADKAAMEISNPKPKLESLENNLELDIEGLKDHRGDIQVTMKGEYILPETKIIIGGQEVEEQHLTRSADGTEVKVTVNLTGPDLSFQFYTVPKNQPAVEGDGGFSPKLYILGGNPVNIEVKVVNATRKYGQPNPEFAVTVEVVDGENRILLEASDLGLTRDDLFIGADDLVFETFANPDSRAGNYTIFISRTEEATLLAAGLELLNFKFINGVLSIEKMPLKITPKNVQITYGTFPENIDYEYELPAAFANDQALKDQIRSLHRQYIPENGMVVLNGMNEAGHGVVFDDFDNKSILASAQSLLRSRKLVYENGVLKPLTDPLNIASIGDQRFIVDLDVQSMANFKANPKETALVPSYNSTMPRGLLSLKELAKGTAQVSINGQLQPIVNGQLRAVVNGQLQALVNGQLRALVNGVMVDAADITFLNGQLRALVNGVWLPITNGQLRALVNNVETNFNISINSLGELVAVAVNAVDGTIEMQVVNGQLRAIVNGQLVALVNGQLRAIVNGQLVPIVNGQLVAMVNGQLKAVVNGLVAMINGQLMAMVNGQLELVEDISLVNGQLKAVVNGQLVPIVNGQLKAVVNGLMQDVDTDDLSFVNGQLKAVVNGQLVPIVNGQLKAVVNGQLVPIVNGEAVGVNTVYLINGQLKAVVNGVNIPIQNGQLQALVNGQLVALVNGQLMEVGDADVNGAAEVNFVVFANGQLRALVNGQLQPIVNGQLKAVVNGDLQNVNSYTIVNGQLKAVVNGVAEEWIYANGQLVPIVNGQLQAVVNNFDISGTNNNAGTMVVVDEFDLLLQGGDISSMFALPMITGANAGAQKIIPAAFINENFEVTYGLGDMNILKKPILVKATDLNKVYGSPNPALSVSLIGLAYDDEDFPDFALPGISTTALQGSPVGVYPITLAVNPNVQSGNYTLIYENGELSILRAPLTIRPKDVTITQGTTPPTPIVIIYDGLVNGDQPVDICGKKLVIPSPLSIEDTETERTTTYKGITFNGSTTNVYKVPARTTSITLTGIRESRFNSPNPTCPSCEVSLRIGMANLAGTANIFAECYRLKANVRWNATLSITFQVPTVPGIYRITQIMTPGDCGSTSTPIHNNIEGTIAYVLVGNVQVGTGISASYGNVNSSSAPGTYPITLSGCEFNNPNYDVTFENGILTILSSGSSPAILTKSSLPEDNSQVKENIIFPNPAQTTIRYRISDEVMHVNDIQVIDNTGRIHATQTRPIGDGVYETNVSGLSNSLYFLRVKTVTGIKTLKFVKL